MTRVRIHDDLTGAELRQWREQQPGEHRNGPGWTQKEAANWAGCGHRSWHRWENPESQNGKVPRWLIKKLQDRRASFDEIVDRIFDTPDAEVERMDGIIPELAPTA